MTLTKKILLSTVFICILFSLGYFVLYRLLLAAPIEEQKNLRAKQVVQGALSVLNNEIDRITTITDDWAMWDSMYRYASKPDKAFEKDLAVPITLQDTELSIIVVLDKKREIILMGGYDHKEQQYVSMEFLKQARGRLWNFLMRSFEEKRTVQGYVESPHGVLLAVSAPILHSDNTGPANGRLMMGRLIDRSIDKKIAEGIREEVILQAGSRDVELCPLEGKKLAGDLAVFLQEQSGRLLIDHPIRDVDGRHVLTIRIAARKEIFEILETATQLFLALLMAGFLLFGSISYYINHRLVVRRVQTISAQTGKIISFEDLSRRLPENYNDEITRLATNFNKMLKRLEGENIKREEIERMLVLNDKLVCLGKVSSSIAHEVNNPLFAIANAFRLIRKQLPPGDQNLEKLADMVEAELRRVRTITKNMHQLSIRNLEAPSHCNLSDIIHAAVNVTLWSKQLKNTRIDYKKDGREFPLTCNPGTLQQVFINLIVNAVEATGGEGEITIDVSEETNGDYRIDFADNGPGFSTNIKKDLFKPFKTTKTGKGTGQGLYISNNIITNHGGAITIDNTEKMGAHMVIRLPKQGPSPGGDFNDHNC